MYHSRPHISEFLVMYFRKKELDELYLSVFLKTLAESFIMLFIPIYLLTIGYRLLDVSIYYLVYYVSVGIFIPFSMFLNSRIGIKKTLALGTFVLIFYYYLLNFLAEGFSYFLVAVTFGIGIAMYCSAFHIEFTRSAVTRKEGSELSMLSMLAIIAGVAGPLIGSLFISKISFNFLFNLVAAILFVSIIPLFFTKDFTVQPSRFSLKKIARTDSKRKAVTYQAGAILGTVSGIFWPIFIYLNLRNIVSLGAIASFTSLFMIFIIAFVGRQADKNKKRTLKYGVFFHAPSWVARLLFLSPIGIFISNFYSAVTSSLIDIPFNKMIYERAKKTKTITDYFMFREFNLLIGRIFILVIAILTNSIFWMFVVSFFVTFIYLIMLKEKPVESNLRSSKRH